MHVHVCVCVCVHVCVHMCILCACMCLCWCLKILWNMELKTNIEKYCFIKILLKYCFIKVLLAWPVLWFSLKEGPSPAIVLADKFTYTN